jgi:poly-gamma-glutamate capsule biosynthesis protein CapA/YwtB (metallophosphatase superfamily)
VDDPGQLRKELERRSRAIGHRRSKRRLLAGTVLGVVTVIAIALVTISGNDWSLRGPTESGRPAYRTEKVDSAEDVARATISTSGDILIHSPVWSRALANGGGKYDFSPMFGAIEPFVAGVDLAICHLETPLTTGEPSGYPLFATPTALADDIEEAGWKVCSTASNHTLDQGEAGIRETLTGLRRAGVRQTGSAIDRKGAARPLIVNAGQFKVGLVSYTDFNNTGQPPNEWNLNLLPYDAPVEERADRVESDVEAALKAGADTVLVIIQWGTENATAPNESQRRLARAVTRIPGVAGIAGQGPHVVQPIERINGKFVVFSSGNLLSNQSAAANLPAETQYGLIALFRLRDRGEGVEVARLDYVPIWVRPGDYLIEPVGWGLKNDPGNSTSLRAAWESTVSIAGKGRAIRPIPVRLGRDR